MVKMAAQWIDIVKPTEKDLGWIGNKFGIHPMTLEELKGPSARAHVEVFKNYVYFVHYFPSYDPVEETSWRAEIDFIVTRNAVITVHYEDIEPLKDFKHKAAETPLRLVYHIIRELIDFEERQLRHIGEKTEAIGHELFKNREKEVLERISRLKRDVSEYRIIVRNQTPILHSLHKTAIRFGKREDIPYLEALLGEHLKIMNQLDDYREAISDFEDTNNQLMNIKTTEAMRTFTTLSFLTFPFMLIAAIFSMNLKSTPLEEHPSGFWIVLAGMIIAIAALATYFKKRGWI